MKKGKPSALLPIAVFLVFYLGFGIYSEYILKIPMGFYNIPIVVSFLTAILVACLQNRSVPFEEKLALMGHFAILSCTATVLKAEFETAHCC